MKRLMGALRYNEITWAIAYFLGPMLQAMCIMCVWWGWIFHENELENSNKL